MCKFLTLWPPRYNHVPKGGQQVPSHTADFPNRAEESVVLGRGGVAAGKMIFKLPQEYALPSRGLFSIRVSPSGNRENGNFKLRPLKLQNYDQSRMCDGALSDREF